jgi:hypothetical protein
MKTENQDAGKAARWARQAADPDAASLRTVGRRLALLTVGLLMVLLLAMGAVVYGTTRYMLMQSLQSTLRSRADSIEPRFTYLTPGGGFGDQNGPDGRQFDPNRNGGGVFVVITDTNLNVVSGAGPAGATLPDPAAAQDVLNGDTQNEFSTQQIDTGGPYLIYTTLVTSRDGTIVLGVLQASISEQQYESDLRTLLIIRVLPACLPLAPSAPCWPGAPCNRFRSRCGGNATSSPMPRMSFAPPSRSCAPPPSWVSPMEAHRNSRWRWSRRSLRVPTWRVWLTPFHFLPAPTAAW